MTSNGNNSCAGLTAAQRRIVTRGFYFPPFCSYLINNFATEVRAVCVTVTSREVLR